MAPYLVENSGFNEHFSSTKSGDMLGPSKDSQTLAKPTIPGRRDWSQPQVGMQAPTIRVIHIFAPKVIKTDVANFRSIVQKLTGRTRRPSSTTRRARTKTVSSTPESNLDAVSRPSSQEIIQRLAETSSDLGRCNSMESNFSLCNSMDSNFSQSNSVDSNTSVDDFQSSMQAGGIFYPHRQAPYSLNEIPAPFFSGDIHPGDSLGNRDFTLGNRDCSLSSPCSARRESLAPSNFTGVDGLGFSDMDILTGLGSTGPLPEFPMLPPLGNSSGLYDMFMPPLCRLSVGSAFHGATPFEF